MYRCYKFLYIESVLGQILPVSIEMDYRSTCVGQNKRNGGLRGFRNCENVHAMCAYFFLMAQ